MPENSRVFPAVLVLLTAIVLTLGVATPSSANGFTAVWRPSEPAPSTAYNYFYLIQEQTGDIYAIFTNGRDHMITDIVKVANLFTGEVTRQNLTAEWVKNNPGAIDHLSELFGVEPNVLRQYYEAQLSHTLDLE